MNELMLPFMGSTPALTERAERIRSLVNVARGCIVEVGRELIEAKAVCAHGGWLPWLQAEFGWTERTAQKYVAVAEAFKCESGSYFNGLTIDATALYALAAPDVPQSVRDQAVGRAEAGERITKTEAEAMVADAQANVEQRLRAAIEAQQQAAAEGLKQAMERAARQYAKDTAMLQAEIQRINAEQYAPDVPQAIEVFCKILDKPKLSPNQLRLVAQILGTTISDGKRTYEPVSAPDAKQMEENLRIASAADRAIEYFAIAPTPDVVLAAALPTQRDKAARMIGAAIDWLNTYRSLLNAQ